MAVGDSASYVGYSLVPNTGTEGQIRYGAREINRTRDYVADVKITLDSRLSGTITRGTADPVDTNGVDGDIYLKMV
jgi:hypothetical protein